MRVTIGLVGVLGFGMSVALAQGPGPVRGARLLPPQPLESGEMPTVARGAAESLPLGGGSTPVTRPGAVPVTGVKNASGPAWVNGTAAEGGVRTASGAGTGSPHVRQLTTKDDLAGSRGPDKFKLPLGQPPAGASDPRNTATANTPFQGKAANGQVVYAGPPAYRWYGWGSVTPGANPIAPGGRYPAASANWYAITGATPGAFPVPVTNAGRTVVGTEPPMYASTGSVGQPITHHAVPHATNRPAANYPPAPVETTVLPQPTIIPPAMPVSVKPTPEAEAVKPVTVPTMTAPPGPIAPIAPPSVPPSGVGSANAAEPTGSPGPLPPIPHVPAAPVSAHDAKLATTPSPLPVSVTDEQRWQPGNARPASSEWTPGGTPSPVTPMQPQSRAAGREPVARGQAEEAKPDPVAVLIRRLCEDRAGGVEVRWTGTRTVTVCFECRDATEAQRLVKDISARPEVIPYQIDFRVLVK